MFLDHILDNTVRGLHKALDLTWRRNEAIASNVANAETPKYRAVDLSFAGELDRAFGDTTTSLSQTHAQHMDVNVNSTAHTIADFSGMTKADGNNVDIDIQMGRLSFNSAKYNAAATALRRKFAFIRNAINETKG